MTTNKYIDGVLVDWGASLFGSEPVTPVSPKRGLTGLIVPKGRRTGTGGATSGANGVRGKLSGIAKKHPEVMVKISGGGKGMKQIRAHLDYITRHGRLEGEDQDGDVLAGKEDVQSLKGEWQYGGFQIPDEGSRREAFNIVLSMPAGTDEVAVHRAAKEFAASEFGGHQYVMVLHTFATDPDPTPSKNPHVHLCVKARSMEGVRLNPRKADLQRWREGFAEALRSHGVEAAATRRPVRLRQKDRGEKQAIRRLKVRGEAKQVGRSKASPVYLAKARATEAAVLRGYEAVASALSGSERADDRQLAVELVKRLRDVAGRGADRDGVDHPPER